MTDENYGTCSRCGAVMKSRDEWMKLHVCSGELVADQQTDIASLRAKLQQEREDHEKTKAVLKGVVERNGELLAARNLEIEAHAETKRKLEAAKSTIAACNMPIGLYLGTCGHYWDSTEVGIEQCPTCRSLADATNEAVRECAKLICPGCAKAFPRCERKVTPDAFGCKAWDLRRRFPLAFAPAMEQPAAPVERPVDKLLRTIQEEQAKCICGESFGMNLSCPIHGVEAEIARAKESDKG